ncbi:DUF7093 family protein [Halolamina sp. C58]|uniref:DUF7093 family protein n=1 Tax=Halolamina sp. C58 TaxID=3421640 RepID=UPI003EBE6CF2
MGLRCLLGHDFGEPETERERNEEGNEVVVTVREVKTCERCGEKQVVSENKEITSIDQLRESAADEQPREESASDIGVSAGTDAGEQWGDDDLATGQTEPATATEPEQPGEQSATVEPDEDPIERGVADIIEQAEKDDDMLEGPAEEPASEEAAGDESEPDDEPVHPGQRSAAAEESDAPDAAEDDGVILDDDAASPPEEGRHQWEEEASPDEVPGDELSVGDSATPEEPDEDDAEIIDASDSSPDPSSADPASEPSTTDDEPQQSSTPSAVESEDAEIVDADPATGPSDPSPDASQPEPASPEREETDEGHMPWPEGPGEDEGHDATAPDGEPVDVDFGDFVPAEEESNDAETDRANGHRTDEGESSEQSTAPTANVDLERSSRDAELEYFCPECGLTRDVGTSSMRAGDICPECHVGYISEQQKAE